MPVARLKAMLLAMDLLEADRRLRELIAAIPPPSRAEMFRVLTIRDDAERAREIGDLHRGGIVSAMAELLIDAEEDPYLRALLVGMLRDGQGL